MADHFDPSTILERFYDLRGYRHAPDILDIAARHGLPPRDDREGLHDGARIFGHPLRTQPLKESLHAGITLKPPARGQLHQFHVARAPRLLQLLKQLLHAPLRERFIVEKPAQFGERHRRRGAEQRCLQYQGGFLIIHVCF